MVNAASIEVASNDKVKTDLRDSKKIAEQLTTQRLKAIHIPSVAEEARRALTRGREQVVEMRATVSLQIKSKLQYFGLMARGDKRLISSRYLKEIEVLNLALEVQLAFQMLIEQWKFFTNQILEFRKALIERADKNKEFESDYRSVPGIGLITSRTLANELGDLSR